MKKNKLLIDPLSFIVIVDPIIIPLSSLCFIASHSVFHIHITFPFYHMHWNMFKKYFFFGGGGGGGL